jgi:UDP-N-acetylmuramate--alanine ligase
MKKIQSIHFVGIKGVGMTPLALIAKESGIRVTGSDIADTFITDQVLHNAGINPLVGFDPTQIGDIDLVITTGAHGGFSNPQVIEAKNRGIPVLTKGQAVGAFMKGELLHRQFEGIAIAGTHGKTTTSAMAATLLQAAGLDPTYIIGTSDVATLGASGHLGRGKYFIAEADEYATEPNADRTPQFLWQHPKIAVITNIDHDHVDIYQTIDDVRQAFANFMKNIHPDGVLIACGDNQETRKVLIGYEKRVITYGFSQQNDYVITRFSSGEGTTFFRVQSKGVELGEFSIQVAGEHNSLNALAAILVGIEVGIPLNKIKQGIKTYRGSKRRFEKKGVLPSGALLYDDYAHHPTEIKNTLKAFRTIFPKKRVICIFQPHTYSRTKQLFIEFQQAFSDADQVIIVDIYASKREAADVSVSSVLLVEQMRKYHKDVKHIPTIGGVVEYIQHINPRSDTVVVLMGAGDIYKIADSLGVKHES